MTLNFSDGNGIPGCIRMFTVTLGFAAATSTRRSGFKVLVVW